MTEPSGKKVEWRSGTITELEYWTHAQVKLLRLEEVSKTMGFYKNRISLLLDFQN